MALSSSSDDVRFRFGENWRSYVAILDQRRVELAERSLRDLLSAESLEGKTFLDAGCGSGVFSLAARRLGATVYSFDFDEESVACTSALKRGFFDGDPRWTIQQGSVLDHEFLTSLGVYDIVYSWGVLHHTGKMWSALDEVAHCTAPQGVLCIAIYNDQGVPSRIWRAVKKLYNQLPEALRFLVLWPALLRLWGPTLLRDAFTGQPLRTWRSYGAERGMAPLVDVKDWVGGYPFEVATPAQVIEFCSSRRFRLLRSVLRSGIGCNEFVFTRTTPNAL